MIGCLGACASRAVAGVERVGARSYDTFMLRQIGKLMQVAALVLLPVSMLMQITAAMRANSVSVMLLMLLFGIALFSVGRLVEGLASK